jgi:hypothetical protein
MYGEGEGYNLCSSPGAFSAPANGVGNSVSWELRQLIMNKSALNSAGGCMYSGTGKGFPRHDARLVNPLLQFILNGPTLPQLFFRLFALFEN